MGIPTVAQVPKVTEQIAEGDLLIVDGFAGEVIVRPDQPMRAGYREKVAALQATMSEPARRCHEPARTRDGTSIRVLANVGCREDAAAAAENGADGVGLCRLEQTLPVAQGAADGGGTTGGTEGDIRTAQGQTRDRAPAGPGRRQARAVPETPARRRPAVGAARRAAALELSRSDHHATAGPAGILPRTGCPYSGADGDAGGGHGGRSAIVWPLLPRKWARRNSRSWGP